MKKTSLNLTALILLLSFFVYLSCSEDCADCPTCPEEPISDYNFYLGNFASQREGVTVYNTKQREIIDYYSFSIQSSDMAISADETKLMVSTHIVGQPDSILVFSIPNMDIVASYPIYGEIEVSNTGSYIAVLDDTLTFLDGNTFNVLFTDTGKVEVGRFSLDDSLFYTVYDNRKIRIYDMAGESLYTEIDYSDGDTLFPSLRLLQPAPDKKKIYFLATYGSVFNQYLINYHLESDSTGYKYAMGGGIGDMQITPDGKQIIVTDPTGIHDELGSHHIIFINPDNDGIISIVPGLYSMLNVPYYLLDPGAFAITPDSRLALFTMGPGGSPGTFGLVDLIDHRFVDIKVCDSDSIWVVDVWCQKFK